MNNITNVLYKTNIVERKTTNTMSNIASAISNITSAMSIDNNIESI